MIDISDEGVFKLRYEPFYRLEHLDAVHGLSLYKVCDLIYTLSRIDLVKGDYSFVNPFHYIIFTKAVLVVGNAHTSQRLRLVLLTVDSG